jgi:photosystem II stability/assembly factor-like uncharacterized protein
MKAIKISILIFLVSTVTSNAQKFLSKEATHPLTFQEMQLKFNDWSKTVNLKKEKGWKYFKRWEMDMQMHTDAKGNPCDPAAYVDAVIQAAHEKKTFTSSRFSVAAWSPVGPNVLPGNLTGYMENGLGRINCIAFHPTIPSTYFVGVAQGGVWKTTNSGQSWTPLTDQLPILRISDICIDPVNTNVMYISVCDFEYIGFGLMLNGRKRNTHYGLGVYKTADGGTTWQPTGLSFQLTDGEASLIRKVIVHPTNTNRLVACGTSGMYTSNDAGVTWQHNLDSLFWDMVQDPVDPNTLYAATGWVRNANDGNAAIYKSIDFGITWTMLNTGIPLTGSVQRIKLSIAASDHNYIYAMAVDSVDGMYGVFKSTNAGASWNYINPGVNVLENGDGTSPGGQGSYDLGFHVDAADKNKLYVGGVNLWESQDGGNTFDPVSHWTLQYGPTLHGDIHFITQQPQTGNYFVCSDGGVYRTSGTFSQTWDDANNGSPWPTQWTKISDGLAISSFYRISSSKNTSGRLIAGAQDNATFYFDGTSWNTIFGGDGMDNYLDPLSDDIIGSSQYGNFDYSNDGGFSTNFINPNVNNEYGEWTTPIVADYNSGALYTGYENVNESTDGGNTWFSISSFPVIGFANDEISALAVSNTNSSTLYAAKRVRYEYSIPGSLYETSSGGSSWNDVTSGIPDSLYYTSVDISNTNSNTAYIAMAGLSAGNKVFKTANGGSSWQNISYNLPNLPVNCIKSMPNSSRIMAATDIGIYTLDSGSVNWINQSTGLPNVIISDIEFNVPLNKIYVCTFGRGIWEADLDAFTVNVDQLADNLDIELYPSVNDGSFTIDLHESALNETFKLSIVDVTGRIIYSSTLAGHQKYKEQLTIPPGMYFARLRGKNISEVKNFVVE